MDNEAFILADSGEGDINRIIIYCTPSMLSLLSKSNTWFVDGTFTVCPSLFYQLYTINVMFHGKNMPCLYALLPGKKTEHYLRLFNLIVPHFKNAPKFIMSDFEKAELNVIRDHQFFKDTTVRACYFHFAQNLWRNMQVKHLSNLYISDSKVRSSFKRLKSLAYLKPADVIVGFEFIKDISELFGDMILYFEKYYIGNKD